MKDFWEKVKKGDGCWEWMGGRDSVGYGQIGFYTKEGKKSTLKAHRIAWELTNGPIPKGLVICHKCDHPPCVRPDHLFVGTYRDNKIDSVNKGRHYKGGIPPKKLGREHPHAILNEDAVKYIRDNYTGKYGELTAMGNRFGVSRSAIYRVLKGDNWNWFTKIHSNPRPIRRPSRNQKIQDRPL